MPETWGEFTEILKELLPWLAVSSVIIEIIPIKINPWSWLMKKIGKVMNEEVLNKIKEMEEENKNLSESVENVKAAIAEKDAKDARLAILRFCDELSFYPERKYSKDRFDDAVHRITEYDKYCDEHPGFQNHLTKSASKVILAEYEKRLAEHLF